MAEDATTESNAPAGGEKSGKKSNKIAQFIKKNKTLSVVVGAGVVYFIWTTTKGGEAGGGIIEENPEGNVPPLGESEVERDGHAAIGEELGDIREEIDDVREEQGEFENENSEKHIEEPEGGYAEQPGETIDGGGEREGPTTEVGPAKGGLTVHGKFFAGATGSRIANTGESEKGKPWIEYAITYPGRQEHWRYFTKSGNWSEVKNSATGGGANKPGKGNGSGNGTGNGNGNGGGNAGGGGSAGGTAAGPKPAGTPSPNHPNAVSTGNACVNGGVGPHKAPKGYHLFCEAGTIYRAPDQQAVSPGKVVAPAPAPAPQAPQCSQQTADAIRNYRNAIQSGEQKINGLQNHIQQLTNVIQDHPNAKQRQQWINERDADRREIDSTRNFIDGLRPQLAAWRQQPGCGNV